MDVRKSLDKPEEAALLELEQRDLYRLAGETGITPKTIRRWATGGEVSSGNRYALEAGALKLEIKLPAAANGRA